MINVKLNNPPIILTPLTEEEAKNNFGFAELYQEYEEGKRQYLKEKNLYLLLSDAIIAVGKSNNKKNL